MKLLRGIIWLGIGAALFRLFYGIRPPFECFGCGPRAMAPVEAVSSTLMWTIPICFGLRSLYWSFSYRIKLPPLAETRDVFPISYDVIDVQFYTQTYSSGGGGTIETDRFGNVTGKIEEVRHHSRTIQQIRAKRSDNQNDAETMLKIDADDLSVAAGHKIGEVFEKTEKEERLLAYINWSTRTLKPYVSVYERGDYAEKTPFQITLFFAGAIVAAAGCCAIIDRQNDFKLFVWVPIVLAALTPWIARFRVGRMNAAFYARRKELKKDAKLNAIRRIAREKCSRLHIDEQGEIQLIEGNAA